MFSTDELQQLYRYCYSLTVNETSAYDLLQTALEKFLKSNTYKQNKQAFMYRVIRNQFIDDFRQQNLRQYEPFEEQDYPDYDVKTLESIAIDNELIEQVLECLQPIEREILFYWALEGHSTRQIAELLDLPKGTVLSKIHRMRLRITERFGSDFSSVANDEEAKP